MSDTSSPRPWDVQSTEVVQQYSIFAVHRVRARSPRNGLPHDFIVVEPSEAVAVVALTPQDELVLVEQFRFGTLQNTLELPGGVLDGDEPLAAARRELREETGYEAAHLTLLGTVDLNPSWQSTRIHFVLATGAVPAGAQDQDEAEDIRVRPLPLDLARRLVTQGQIRNAVTIVGLCLYGAQHPPRGR